MKKHFLLLTFLMASGVCFSQTDDADKHKHINLPAYLIELQQLTGTDSIVHVDSTYGFEVIIPQWWHIRETPRSCLGGTFPAVDSIENALLIKCFAKEGFKDLADFENYIIKDYSIGQSPKWSNRHKLLLRKEVGDFRKLGNAYKVQMLMESKIYDCCYIITATSTAYIWIDFTATGTTYPKNYDRFKEVVGGFKVL